MAINTNFPYISPTPGEIMILAVTPYHRMDDGSGIKKDVFTRVIDCGFNAITVSDTEDNIRKCFSILKGMDLSVIMCDEILAEDEEQKQNTMIALINEFKNNPLLGGYELKDEPLYSYLPTLKTFVDKIRGVDTSHMIDINLACSLEEKWVDSFTTYQAYLDYFQDEFTPAVWSHDFYPIRVSGRDLKVEVSGFFEYMQLFYGMGKRTNRPIWAYCMCMSYVEKCVNNGVENTCVLDGTKSGRPDPTEGELRFEAFSALAYGAQGIFYWAYTQRDPQALSKDNAVLGIWNEYYTNAPIDLQGTDTFSAAFGYISNLEVRGEGVLVSHIRNKGYNYIVIVNHDPMNAQQIKLEFTDPDRIENLIDNGEEEEEPGFSPDDKDWIGLLAGGYLIYRIK